jgi:hypothetical protein
MRKMPMSGADGLLGFTFDIHARVQAVRPR